MTKIEWNKVTWYSKLIALALFVALPFIGFWFGTNYGEAVAMINATNASSSIGGGSQSLGLNSYYSNVADWQPDQRPDGGFSIAYPIDFQPADNYSLTPTPDWRLSANGELGMKLFTLSIPSAFEPQTNFSDATLVVGKSATPAAIANCLTPDQLDVPGALPPASTTIPTITINGAVFSIFHFTGVGAGNYYDTTSYRILHAGACYAVEYTIHSGQILNYPAQYHLQPYDGKKLTDVLNRIVGTFKFL
jgi:hypothetical protein